IFFGFHMTPETAVAYSEHKEYFKRFEPIGCRDHATAEYLRSWGVEAYVSGCATMTFPRQSREPNDPKLVLVDQTRKHFPHRERRGHVSISHVARLFLSAATRYAMARELLRYYRDEAGLIITSRIHC